LSRGFCVAPTIDAEPGGEACSSHGRLTAAIIACAVLIVVPTSGDDSKIGIASRVCHFSCSTLAINAELAGMSATVSCLHMKTCAAVQQSPWRVNKLRALKTSYHGESVLTMDAQCFNSKFVPPRFVLML